MSIAVLREEPGFLVYMDKISKLPFLTEEEERDLGRQWSKDRNVEAARKIISSHLRLVVKVAMKFRNYGLPMMDLVSEGNIGLMKAVRHFNIDMGCKVATYAVWWIRAAIQEYIVKSWSMVKIGTTSAQRKLFFNLKRIKQKLLSGSGKSSLDSSDIDSIAADLSVSRCDVKDMDVVLSGSDYSLNNTVSSDGSDVEFQDLLASKEPNQEVTLIKDQEKSNRRKLLLEALNTLDERYRDIFVRRKLVEKSHTLEVLSNEYGISKERVRQIENRSMKKIVDYFSNCIQE